jgi:hypothetical protein
MAYRYNGVASDALKFAIETIDAEIEKTKTEAETVLEHARTKVAELQEQKAVLDLIWREELQDDDYDPRPQPEAETDLAPNPDLSYLLEDGDERG